MPEWKERRPGRRMVGERGTSRLKAAVFLGLIVVMVGVVGYLVLQATTPAGTAGSTARGCTPANSPVCKGESAPTIVSSRLGAIAG